MSDVASNLKDDEFIFAYVADYQDGELPEETKERFGALLAKKDSNTVDKFLEARGHFQMAFQELKLDQDQVLGLHRFVEDDVARANHEAGNIRQLGAMELRGNSMRAFALISLVFIGFCLGYYYLAPTKRPKFHALENLVYEAVVMAEEGDRLDFPTSDIGEVRHYISKYPKLGFKAVSAAPIGGEWTLDGVTVIDYEFVKIPTIQYSHKKLEEKLFVFQYDGDLTDLPSSEQGRYNNLVYQSYSDDSVNIIAWQARENVVGMMIGKRGAAEMAKLAKASSAQ